MTTATMLGSPRFPAVPVSTPASTKEAIDAAVQTLQSKKNTWVNTSVDERLSLIEVNTAEGLARELGKAIKEAGPHLIEMMIG